MLRELANCDAFDIKYIFKRKAISNYILDLIEVRIIY